MAAARPRKAKVAADPKTLGSFTAPEMSQRGWDMKHISLYLTPSHYKDKVAQYNKSTVYRVEKFLQGTSAKWRR